MSKIVLGALCRDRYTDFQGICVAIVTELGGVESAVLSPKAKEDGTLSARHTFHVGRLDLVAMDENLTPAVNPADEEPADEEPADVPPNANAVSDVVGHTVGQPGVVPPPPADTPQNTVPRGGEDGDGYDPNAELDIEGVPLNKKIHSSTGTKTKEGKWTRRRNISDELYSQVTAELKRIYGTQTTAAISAVSGKPGVVPPPPQTKQEQVEREMQTPPASQTPGINQGVAPGNPGVESGFKPVSASGVLARKVLRLTMNKVISLQEVDAAAQALGYGNYWELMSDAKPECIEAMNDTLDEREAAANV